MSELEDLELHLKDAREKFLQIVDDIRPSLHKYCARMTGSVFDGEDVVQETLAQAYYKLSMLRQGLPLKPWLFRIAHNKCVDFLRSHRGQFVEWQEEHDQQWDAMARSDEGLEDLERHEIAREAWSSLITLLPPKERACVILKDILDHSMEEIAEILDTPPTAVKVALHRGRQKLRSRTQSRTQSLPNARASEHSEQLARYVELFNRRDWEGIKRLLTTDTQCEVIGAFSGRGRDAIAGSFLQTLAGLGAWKMSCIQVDGEEVIVRWHSVDGQWQPRGLMRIEWEGRGVKRIRDYTYVSYVFDEIDFKGQEPAE